MNTSNPPENALEFPIKLNPREPLLVLGERVPWEEFDKLCKLSGDAGVGPRCLASLIFLQRLSGLPDRLLLEQWRTNPYWQLFSGEREFKWDVPLAANVFEEFRERIGREGVTKIETIFLNHSQGIPGVVLPAHGDFFLNRCLSQIQASVTNVSDLIASFTALGATAQEGSVPLVFERRRNLATLSACALLLVWFALAWQEGLGASFSNDWDEGVYLTSARMVMLGEPLFSSVFSSQPPVFIELIATAFHFFGDTVETGRAVILVSALLALATIGAIAWRMFGAAAAPLAIGAMGFSTYFFPHARTCQAEIPALAFSLMSIYTLLLANGRWRGVMAGSAGGLFALGALTKLLVAPMLVPLAALLIYPSESFFASRGGCRRTVQEIILMTSWLVAGGLLMTVLVVSPYNLSALFDQVVLFHTSARDIQAGFASNKSTLEDLFLASFGLFVTAAVGLAMLARSHARVAMWLYAWFLVTVVFLFTHRPLFPRHCMLALFPVALAASAAVLAFSRLWSATAWRFLIVVIAGLPLVMLVENRGKRTIDIEWTPTVGLKAIGRGFGEQERQVIDMIRTNTKPSDLVVSDQQMQVFRAGRMVPPALCDTSTVRIASGYLPDTDAIAQARGSKMIILWTGRLGQLPRFVEWVESQYSLAGKFGQKKVYLKNEEPRVPVNSQPPR